MSKRKMRKKALDFFRIGTPYQATWAHTPEEVPVWDPTRGFPIELSIGMLTPREFDEMYDYVVNIGKFDLANPNEVVIGCIRWMLRNYEWTPKDAPKGGYPRLVRESIREPTQKQICEDKSVLNDLAQLVRHDPKSPSAWVLEEIVALNAKLGPPADLQNNTLASWLEMANKVKVHFAVCRAMYLGGYEAACQDIDEHRRQLQFEETPAGRSTAAISMQAYMALFFVSARCAPSPGEIMRTDFTGWAEDEKPILLKSGETFVSEKQFLTQLAELLGGAVKHLSLHDDTYVSTSTLNEWVDYKLLEIWQPNAHILDCAGCGQPFFAKREGKSYCHNRCHVLKIDREKAKRKREQRN